MPMPRGFPSVLALLALVAGACCPEPAKARVSRWLHPGTGRALHAPVIGQPIRGARAWATALVPNRRGGWNYITQTYEAQSASPTEFVVLDLATGKQTRSEGPSGVYTNSNYQSVEQVRATNGRVFLPELDNHLAYYDPVDEAVHLLDHPIVPPGDDKMIFRLAFGPDGMLYGGTQSNGLPTIFWLDPDTLQSTVLGKVGKDRHSYSYAYYLAADPPWVYVAVGEAPWELAALNVNTREMRILATRPEGSFMQLETRATGIVARLFTAVRTPQARVETVWCVDGAIVPFDPTAQTRIPFAPRNVTPRDNPIRNAPEIDRTSLDADSDGVGRVRWRTGPAQPWRETHYQIRYTTPVEIESLLALPDGTLLGNAKQYQGFFRYDPNRRSIARYGTLSLSGGPRVVVGGLVYLSGYPNGGLFVYDPMQPWAAATNPRRLGAFTQADAQYGYFLAPSSNGRLYFAGRRERVGAGGGVGFYDLSSKTFGGGHDGLSFLSPQGLVVLDGIKRVVYSGRVGDDPARPNQRPREAQLVIYDADLREVDRQTVKPGLSNTGLVFGTASASVILGVIAPEHAVYRYDVATRKLLAWKHVDGELGAATQRASDRSLWLMLGHTLTRIDPDTLETQSFGDIAETQDGAGILEWLGDHLYWASGSQLREIQAPGE